MFEKSDTIGVRQEKTIGEKRGALHLAQNYNEELKHGFSSKPDDLEEESQKNGGY